VAVDAVAFATTVHPQVVVFVFASQDKDAPFQV
jgi:hypothetical protein